MMRRPPLLFNGPFSRRGSTFWLLLHLPPRFDSERPTSQDEHHWQKSSQTLRRSSSQILQNTELLIQLFLHFSCVEYCLICLLIH